MTKRAPLTRYAGVLTALGLMATACGAAPGGDAHGKDTGTSSGGGLPSRLERQKIDWTTCGTTGNGKALAEAECGWVEVPVDYALPAKESIKLRVSRVKATDQDARIGALLYNPGGPGAGAAADVATGAFEPGALASARYDLVGFDPRGIGESAPIGCPTGKDAPREPDMERLPKTKAEADTAFAAAAAHAEACRKAGGPVFSHMDTASVARDLDLLRTVLGDEKLTYVGVSYGTYLGQKYAQMFPSRVGRLVLDGVVDPGRDMLQVTRLDVEVTQDQLLRYAEHCTAGGRCPLGSTAAEAVAAVTTGVERLDADGSALTGAAAADVIAKYLFRPEDWPKLTTALAALKAGDAVPLTNLADPADEGEAEEGDDIGSGIARSAVLCLDGNAPRSAEELLRAADELAARSPIFGRSNAWTMLDCAAWPVPATGKVEPITATGAAPLLLVSYTTDPATPLVNAQTVRKNLATAPLVIRHGTGHGAYASGSPCTDRTVDAYLVHGTLPAPETNCPS